MIIHFDDVRDTLEQHFSDDDPSAVPIVCVSVSEFLERADTILSTAQAAWLEGTGWQPKAGAYALLPGASGLEKVIFVDDPASNGNLAFGMLPGHLPAGIYKLDEPGDHAGSQVLAWALGAYHFDRYVSAPRKPRKLVLPPNVERRPLLEEAQAVWFARELINIPANDLGPRDLANALAGMGKTFGAKTAIVEGDDLLLGFPLIHAVGRASDRAPCLADLTWGDPAHPKLTLVGKGICFDTGGLNIKPAQAMALMKKDMGGAASVIALGAMIMAAKLPVRLRILVAAADNNISANAFRPGDILNSRLGLTVEIANTDAEGRLVLADALTFADEEEPALLIDLATLTGSARVALGPDLSPIYTDDDAFANSLYRAGLRVGDPVWRMPFWQPYDSYLKSKVADVNHVFTGPFAGSITAALFLKRFVRHSIRYVHLDIYGWTPRTLPGKPAGGEPQAARALFEVIRDEFGGAAAHG